ncbi:MAG: hypothetical protein KDB00_12305, partial [Planctomycetales bacterium]|nr:hypothetical protein [Planctomycetales bacterium]
NKAIDSVRYDNALCRGGEGARRASDFAKSDSSNSSSGSRISRLSPQATASTSHINRLQIGDSPSSSASRIRSSRRPVGRRREDFPLDAVRDQNQRSGEEQAASNEVIEYFLEQLSEATLRGIVSLKLHGFTNEEIAEKLGCATRTIERKLSLIRRLWIPILENSDEQRQA